MGANRKGVPFEKDSFKMVAGLMEQLQARGQDITWLKGRYLDRPTPIIVTLPEGYLESGVVERDSLVNNLIKGLKPQ